MTNFNIRIISDNVCPWCYVGKARLDKAISLYKRTYPNGSEDTFNVSWSPFYLDPTAPTQGIPWPQRAAQKFGADRVAAMEGRLRQIGASEGINFSFNGVVGNTRDSHRVIQLAKARENASTPGLQSAVVRSIMKSYFEEDGDITSRDMLVAAAARGGLDAEETRRWLEEGKGGDEVDREVNEAFAIGVSGVPHFIIDGKYQVGGAQDPSEFIAQFVAIKEGKA
ncbi:DSBA-like thioredoxin domain-containing protein [Plectosphaerella plurivora]|uniref:DSBA-like thioredoxin domain-containing protein n=1 Tax=Plectosphaerella plurivora TaxID=936078 RepID=A0A9P8VBI9_9PEZI|nr:DSBA-like thioredoxin domain-containing protein [Plectosphaerella plurivora]